MMTRMPAHRHLKSALFALPLAGLLMLPQALSAQDPSPQQLYESGQDEAALARAEAERAQGQEALEATFVAAQAARRLKQTDRAVAEYQRMAESPNGAWAALGRSGVALEHGNMDEAQAHVSEAINLEGGLGYAHYQLGMVYARRNDHAAAAQAFARAAEIMPSFAYAHYQAGLSFQRAKNVNRMATHFEQFLQLAPDAPERTQVAVIMRSIRG